MGCFRSLSESVIWSLNRIEIPYRPLEKWQERYDLFTYRNFYLTDNFAIIVGDLTDKFCLKQIVCKSPDFLFIFIFENIFLPVDLPGFMPKSKW